MYSINSKVGVINMEKSKNKKRKIENYTKQMLSIIIILILLIGGTYAWLKFTASGKEKNEITVGTLDIVLDDAASKGINIESAFPVTDEVGKSQDEYKFTIKNSGTLTSKYRIQLKNQEIEGTRMPSEYIKYNLVGVKKKSLEDKTLVNTDTVVLDTIDTLDQNNIILPTGLLEPEEEIEYSLRLWISIDADYEQIRGTEFNTRIEIQATQKNNPNQ